MSPRLGKAMRLPLPSTIDQFGEWPLNASAIYLFRPLRVALVSNGRQRHITSLPLMA